MKLILRTPDLRRRAMEAIRAIPLNEVWECDLKPWKSTRSLEANARYWVILTEISEQLRPDGREYSPETWHRFFKAKFLGKDTVVIDGEVLLIERSTAKLKTRVFSDYTLQCEVYGVEHGVKFSDFRQGA